MSGSAGLAAAKRRRAGPSAVSNEAPRRQSNTNTSNNLKQIQQVPVGNISNTHPLIILAQHEQQINMLRSDIEIIQKNTEISNSQSIDEQSLQFFKNKYESVSREMEEMKKLLIKIQTFSMETNLELLKMKRLLKNDPRMKETDEDVTIENLVIND